MAQLLLDPLQYLLKAPSPKVVDKIFVEVYKSRNGEIPTVLTNSLMSALSLDESQAKDLVKSIRTLTKICVYESTSNIGSLFPANFHKDLKTLILQIIDAHLRQWREDSIREQCSLPRLQNVDWRIDVKRASETISNISLPTVLVQLKVHDTLAQANSTVNLELDKQTLETMLDGLSKIKSQLSMLSNAVK